MTPRSGKAPASVPEPARVSTGIPGLDEDLPGRGPARYRQDDAGAALPAGRRAPPVGIEAAAEDVGEKGLYVTLSESERERRLVAARHGWPLDDVSLFELVPPEASLEPER